MLESEARKKICPLMTHSVAAIGTDAPLMPILCQGSDCMGWDKLQDMKFIPMSERTEGGQTYELISFDPPRGDCGMKPKELACNA